MSESWMNEEVNEWIKVNCTGYQEKLLAWSLIMNTRKNNKKNRLQICFGDIQVILIIVIYLKFHFLYLITMQGLCITLDVSDQVGWVLLHYNSKLWTYG